MQQRRSLTCKKEEEKDKLEKRFCFSMKEIIPRFSDFEKIKMKDKEIKPTEEACLQNCSGQDINKKEILERTELMARMFLQSLADCKLEKLSRDSISDETIGKESYSESEHSVEYEPDGLWNYISNFFSSLTQLCYSTDEELVCYENSACRPHWESEDSCDSEESLSLWKECESKRIECDKLDSQAYICLIFPSEKRTKTDEPKNEQKDCDPCRKLSLEEIRLFIKYFILIICIALINAFLMKSLPFK